MNINFIENQKESCLDSSNEICQISTTKYCLEERSIESSIKITDGPNPTIKLLPGRRTKKKNINKCF